MQKLNDLSRSLAPLEPDGTLIAVIEMSQSSWLVAGIVPGVERQPLKKLAADEIALLKLLHRWREEAEKAGRKIERTAVAFEAGRDGFWLARWLRTRSIEAHVIHASSVAVSREHRRAKTDRLDTELLKRAFLGCSPFRHYVHLLQLIRDCAVGAHHVGHAVGQDQLRAGWTLRQSEPYGAHLIDPDYDQIFVVPRDVMEHLIRHDIIELEREQ